MKVAKVVAEPVSARELICNTSGAWSAQGFSAGRVTVAVEHAAPDAVLSLSFSPTDTPYISPSHTRSLSHTHSLSISSHTR